MYYSGENNKTEPCGLICILNSQSQSPQSATPATWLSNQNQSVPPGENAGFGEFA